MRKYTWFGVIFYSKMTKVIKFDLFFTEFNKKRFGAKS